MKESNRALRKFTELSQHSDGGGVGSLRGRFQLSNGPGNAGMIAAQFNCEGTTLSGIDFELMTTGYRLSLMLASVSVLVSTGELLALVAQLAVVAVHVGHA